MITLGINAAFHDSAACLVRDGEVVAAAEEERFTRIKHGKRPVPFSTWELPFSAVDSCLREAGATLADVDHVAYSFDPSLLLGPLSGAETIELPLEPSAGHDAGPWSHPWEPLFLSSIVNAPRQLASGAPHHLRARFNGRPARYRWHFVPHHLAHAASTFLASPFETAAVLALDGRGERATTSSWRGCGTRLDLVGEVDMPHSLGLLYERLTEHLGFLHSSDEYKVMALASYGAPRFADAFRAAIEVRDDGTYTAAPLDLGALVPARRRGEPIGQVHFDLAASAQTVLEETALALARALHRATGLSDLCLAGGVALNCVMNARLRDEGPFERIWIQPAAGDAGTALGAALWVDARERGEDARRWRMDTAYLGPAFGEAEVERFLAWAKLPYRRPSDLAGETADLLASGAMIGWFQGRMEFGPRALGARSILASPIEVSMKERLNELKDREDFRPVAPAVLEEEAPAWFEGADRSPFMLFVHRVSAERAARIPAAVHVDGTARIQTVRREHNPLYADLLSAFARRTGVPVLINTSFNTRGEPIVCTPRDAVASFVTSPLDALVIGPFVVDKRPGGP